MTLQIKLKFSFCLFLHRHKALPASVPKRKTSSNDTTLDTTPAKRGRKPKRNINASITEDEDDQWLPAKKAHGHPRKRKNLQSSRPMTPESDR